MKEYKKAFLCLKKGKCAEDSSCPCWCELIQTNIQTGEERLIKDCIFKLYPIIMIEVIKASNRPAAAVESMRNETAKNLNQGFQKVFTGLQEVSKRIKKALEVKDDIRSLPKQKE